MKVVTLTLSDYSPSNAESGIFGFVVFQVFFREDSYGFYANLDAARQRVYSLKQHFNYDFKIKSIEVQF